MVGGWGWGPDWAGWLVMGVSMLLFWGLVVAGIIALVRVINRPSGPPPPPEVSGSGSASARRILDERYARGEIDEEEYRRRRDLLEGGR